MATLQRCVVLHGYRANPERHWFPWLKRELAARGIPTLVPELPTSSQPSRTDWVDTARQAIGKPGPELLIVGHSLGAMTALLALDEVEGAWRLGALCAVAGAAEPIPQLPDLDGFFTPPANVARTARRVDRCLSILSDDDAIVAPELSIRLSTALSSEQILVPGGAHFLGVQGWDTLPPLIDWLSQHARAPDAVG